MIPEFYTKGKVCQKFGSNPLKYLPYGFLGHEGQDYAFGYTYQKMLIPWCVRVPAIEGGIVVFAGNTGNNYGNHVRVDSPSGEWWYCHMNDFNVSVGNRVEVGDSLGATGKSGRTKYYHLHLGWKRKPVNLLNGYKGFANPGIYIANNLLEGITVMTLPKGATVEILDYKGKNPFFRETPGGAIHHQYPSGVPAGTKATLLNGEVVKASNGYDYTDIKLHDEQGWTGWIYYKRIKVIDITPSNKNEMLKHTDTIIQSGEVLKNLINQSF